MPTPLTHTTIHQIKIIGLFLLTAILLIPALSVLSPLYGMPPGADVQWYGVIGRGIFDGFVPYRDLFDQKGPLIFFIYGGLQQLSYSFTPILIFEILCLTTTLYFAYKTALLFCNEKIAIISAILVAFFLCSSAYFEGGGNPSEFILTFQFITLFITAKEWVNKTTQSWLIIGIITSFCCSFAFFLKFNICSFWIIPFLFLIYRSKQKNNLFQFILGGVLGFSILFIPLTIYLVLNNSFRLFIESYFLYSTHYGLSGSTMSYITNYSSIIKKMFLTFNGCYLCICLYVITISRLKPLLKLAIIFSFIITFFAIFGAGRSAWHHCFISLIPYHFMGTLFILSMINIKNDHVIKFNKKVIIQSYFLFIILTLLININLTNISAHSKSYKEIKEQLTFIKNDKDGNFLNISGWDQGFYFITKKTPIIRYFNINASTEDVRESNRLDQFKQVTSKQLKYIITDHGYMDLPSDKKSDNLYKKLLTDQYHYLKSLHKGEQTLDVYQRSTTP